MREPGGALWGRRRTAWYTRAGPRGSGAEIISAPLPRGPYDGGWQGVTGTREGVAHRWPRAGGRGLAGGCLRGDQKMVWWVPARRQKLVNKQAALVPRACALATARRRAPTAPALRWRRPAYLTPGSPTSRARPGALTPTPERGVPRTVPPLRRGASPAVVGHGLLSRHRDRPARSEGGGRGGAHIGSAPIRMPVCLAPPQGEHAISLISLHLAPGVVHGPLRALHLTPNRSTSSRPFQVRFACCTSVLYHTPS